MSASVKQAREALGARLREIRLNADLSGRALAELCGWHFTKVSKLEHGSQPPTDRDIRQWCEHTRAESEVPDLIAAARSVESMYREWHRTMRAGLKRSQEVSVPLYERTKLFRAYEAHVIPGLFHTAGYAAAIFTYWNGFLDLPGSVDEAVAARMERQRVLYSGDRRFMFVLEEQALCTRVGDAAVMAGQLDRLLAVMSLPRISVGIVPADGIRRTLNQGSFWIFDDDRVKVEGLSAGLEITQPREVALFVKAFELFQRSAVFGDEARTLIHTAMRRIRPEDSIESPDRV